MIGTFGLVYPLWLLADETREDDLLEAAVGEAGIERVVIPVVTGPIERALLAGAGSAWFVDPGGWHYPPAPAFYPSSTLRPKAARWVGRRNRLTRLRERAARLGIEVALRVNLVHCTALAHAHPHIAIRDFAGRPQPDAGACISNPDLHELLAQTLDELTSLAPAELQLSGWRSAAATDARGHWNPLARDLATLCFCPSCARVAAEAGLDADALATAVRAALDALAGPSGEPAAAQLVRRWRSTIELANRPVLEAIAVRLRSGGAVPRLTAVNCIDADGWSPITVLAPGSPKAFDALIDAVASGRQDRPASTGIELPAWSAGVTSSTDLVRGVKQLAEHVELASLDFADFDCAPRPVLTWLRQAIRFARRG